MSINNINQLNFEPVELCNGELLCSLWGTKWSLKYYLDEILLHRVNDNISRSE